MKILIADDEPLIHISIEFSLKELVTDDLRIFHASTGGEMISLMEENQIDLALVDIRMPGIDGLTAIDTARKKWPETVYYIMSGFSEFEYARKAVKLEVADYLLKPLDPQQLSEIIEKVRQEQAQRDDQLRSSFHAWAIGTLHKHDVSALYDRSFYGVMVLYCCDSAAEQADPHPFDSIQENYGVCISVPCWEGILSLMLHRDENALIKDLHSLSQKDFPSGVTCFISPVSNDPQKLAAYMHQILDLSPARVLHGVERRYNLRQLLEIDKKDIETGAAWVNWRNSYCEQRYSDYVLNTSSLIPMLGKQSSVKFKNLAKFIHAVTGVPASGEENASILEKCMKEAGESLLQHEGGIDRIDTVIQYVQENYCKDITINSISAKFDLTPNYLSTLFKKKLGVNFVEYLSALRIAEAKRLLVSTNQPIKEISESVGYYSQSHFNKIFMKKEGCTPGEYRARKNNSEQ